MESNTSTTTPSLSKRQYSAKTTVTQRMVDEADLLQHHHFKFMRRIEAEKKALREADMKIRAARENVEQRRRALQEENHSLEGMKDALACKKVPKLENRLDLIHARVSVLENENKRLMEEIDNHRRHRTILLHAKDKLRKDIHNKQRGLKTLHHIVQQLESTKVKLNRDIEKRTSRMIKDVERFSHTLIGLTQDLGLDELRPTSSEEVLHEITRALNARDLATSNKDKTDQSEEVQSIMDESNTYFWTISKKNFELGRVLAKAQRLERCLQLLEQATEVGNVDNLINLMQEAEMENFNLVNTMNDMNSEVERLQEQGYELKAQVEQAVQALNQMDQEAMKKKKELQDKIQHAKAEQQKTRENYMKEYDLYTSIQDSMIDMFKMIGYTKNNESFARQIESYGLTLGNIHKFLGIIEERIIQIIDVHNTFVRPLSAEDPTKPMAPKMTNSHGLPLQPLHLPSCNDMEDEEDLTSTNPLKVAAIHEMINQQGLKEFYRPKLKKVNSANSTSTNQTTNTASNNIRREKRMGSLAGSSRSGD